MDQGLDFFGWNVRRQNGKVLVKPSQKNVHAFQPKARETIKANGSAKQAALIRQLNPILRGWANYRRSQAASKAFQHADAQVFAALWRWARRRHPQKGRQWIRRKYWKSEGNRQWVFATRMFEDPEQLVAVPPVSLAGVKIRRQIKAKADFNPFDPEWRSMRSKAHGGDERQARIPPAGAQPVPTARRKVRPLRRAHHLGEWVA